MAEQGQTNKERLKEITDGIEAGIKELFQSDRFANYLRTMGRFHKYSVNNTLLIHMQKPDATLVAGFQKWKTQFGRSVKRGEKGITIIAPTPFKKKIEEAKLDPDTKLPLRDKDGKIVMEEVEISIPMFKPVTVFDVSQTEGKPLPHLVASLNGRVQNFELMMEAVKRASPVPIVMEAMKPDMDGYFSQDRQEIALRDGMGEAQTVCAAVHEMTHAKLHNYKEKDAIDNKEQYEEAEIFGQPALFSDERIDRSKLPEGLFCYDLRGSDNDPGNPAALERVVAVNHAGSIITAAPIELPEAGYLELNDALNFLGGELSLRAFYEKTHPDKVEKDRNTEEVEAESVSYAVCQYYGIETGENSFGYIASWSEGRELKELRDSLETINRTAGGLINDIDKALEEICKERGIDLSSIRTEAPATGTPAAEAASPEPVMAGTSKSAPESSRPERPSEILLFAEAASVDDSFYLHVQTTDDGYDYTLYDAATMKEKDGGQLDEPDIPISTAALEICEMQGIGGVSMKYAPHSMIKTLQEAQADAAAVPAAEAGETPEQALDEYPMPDPDLNEKDLKQCGYLDHDLLPLSRERAIELFEMGMTVYAIVDGGDAELMFEPEDIEMAENALIFAVDRADWEDTPDFDALVRARMNHQQEREAAFLDHFGDCFAIYQMKSDDSELASMRYMSMDYLQKKGVQPSRDHYELVYTGKLPEGGTLDTLWEQFNVNHPADYKRPSMSVSDIVAVKRDGVVSCHYCDTVGFTEVPGFLRDNPLKNAEMALEDNYNMIDGIINNGPKAPATEPEKKPSVVERLKSQPRDDRKTIHARGKYREIR